MKHLSAFLFGGSFTLVAWVASAIAETPPVADPSAVRIDLVADLKASSPKPPAGYWVLRPEEAGDPIRVEIRPGAPSSVELPLGRRWEIGLEAEGFWAVRRLIVVEPTPAERSVQVEVWPLGVVAGELRLSDRRDKLPESLEVSVLLPAEKRPGVPGGRSACDLKPKTPETVSFTCRLPATKLDLSFQPAGGFSPGYVRGVEVSAAKAIDVQPLILRKGGSVAGWVRVEGGSGFVPGLCLARIEPALGPSTGNPRLGLSLRSTGPESRVAADGSFEFSALAPGVYRLRVDQVGYSPFVSGPIHVLAGIQTLLRDPAVLFAPSDLEVAIQPEADLQGRPWQLTLVLKEGDSHGPAFEGKSNEQGIVRAKGVEAATYVATITDALGNDYWSDFQFHVGQPGEERREIRLDLWSIRGLVRRAEEPLDAVLVFGGKHGSERVRMESHEGKFSGALPRGGRWKVEIEWGNPSRRSTVQADVEETGVRRGEIEIDVPAGRVFGRVANATGQPARGAAVIVTTKEGAFFHTSTDLQGSFEFDGMAKGEATFMASLGEKDDRQTSEPIVQEVSAEEPTGPVVLALRRTAVWTGQVQSGYGPVAGATVNLSASRPGPDLGDTVQSDLDGRYEAHLPSGVTEAVAIALAPGYGVRGVRLARPGGPLNLSPEQGALSIQLPADQEERLVRGERLVVSQDGVTLSLQTLLQWALKLGSPISPYPAPLVIPGMAPGNYRACYFMLDAAWLDSGSAGPGACAAGRLEAGQVLDLKMDPR